MIEPEILEYIPYGENFDFAKDLFPTLMQNDIPLWGYSASGYWRDVGNPQSYREVYQDIFKGDIVLPFKGERKEIDKGIVYISDGVELHEKIRVNGIVVLDENIKISEGVTLTNVSIGKNCKIKKHAELTNSILWDNVTISSKAKINNSVICNNNIIKEETKAPLGVIIN